VKKISRKESILESDIKQCWQDENKIQSRQLINLRDGKQTQKQGGGAPERESISETGRE
jgi:hypothetical protein